MKGRKSTIKKSDQIKAIRLYKKIGSYSEVSRKMRGKISPPLIRYYVKKSEENLTTPGQLLGSEKKAQAFLRYFQGEDLLKISREIMIPRTQIEGWLFPWGVGDRD